MKLELDIPDDAYWRLTSIAEREDITVPNLLTRFAIMRSRVDCDPVTQLVAIGLTDREIARDLGLQNNVVADRRRRAGLPANRRHRGDELTWRATG